MSSSAPTPELITVLALLVQKSLRLDANRIHIYNTKWQIPPDTGLFVEVAFSHEKPFGNNTHFESQDGALVDVQKYYTQETYTITLFSQSHEARQRKHEIPMALSSTLAQQFQEKYAFKLGIIPTAMLDLSELEASARLNRYAITFNLIRSITKTNSVEYFDDFTVPPATILTNP